MLKSVEHLIEAANHGVKAKTLGNHSMEHDDKAIYYRYYWTVVCQVDKVTGKATYNNGGYNTSSTTRTINSYKEEYGEE